MRSAQRSRRLRAALEQAPPDADAMWVALADARSRYPIPARGALGADRRRPPGSLDPRYEPSRSSRATASSSPGPSASRACRSTAPADYERAETLGIALQLINILRDVAEDWSLGRVYLPQDELGSYGVTEADLREGRATEAWRAYAAFHAARCRAYLAEGLRLLDVLDRRSALCVGTFAGLYRETLDRIEASGYDVFSGRPHLSALAKLRIVGQGFLR